MKNKKLNQKLLRIGAVALLTMGSLSSCTKQESKPIDGSTAVASSSNTMPKQGTGVGLIKSINNSGKSIQLSHNDVPGVMDAMTMSYPVTDSTLLSGLKPGDSVTFTLEESEPGDYAVSAIALRK